MKTLGTRWFELSGRELRVLLVVAAMVLLSVAAVRVLKPVLWEEEAAVENVRESLTSPPRLDLNTVKDYELTLLPGIGPKKARAIIEYRNVHGGFKNLEEIVNVPGIGPKELERLRPQLMCAPARRESP